jgi:uncharacterized protein YndB with AHSA1/START domain
MDDAAAIADPAEDRNEAPISAPDLVLDIDLEASMDQVWRAVTEPDLLAAWLAPDAVKPALGGPIDCELLEAEPPSRARYAWRGQEGSGLPETEVCFELTPNSVGGVRLRLTHSGLASETATSGRVVSLASVRRRPGPTLAMDRSALKWAA